MTHLAYLGQGRSYHVEKWLPALVRQGLRVTLISFTAPERETPGVEVRLIKPGAAMRAPKRLRIWHFWGSAKPLLRLLDEIGADVLMASYATNYGWLGVRTGFKPMIAQTWTADISVYPWIGWKRWILRPMVRRFLKDANVITTDGQALADTVRELFPEHAGKVVPIRWGIRLADYEFSESLRSQKRAEMGIPDGAPVLTGARGVFHLHRPEELLTAFLTLLDSRPSAHVVYLTLAIERNEKVQKLLDKLAGHPRGNVFDRFLSVEEMREIWSVTDALVSVPRNDGISEGILEGMYAGCLPVVSDIPSNRSILEDAVSGIFVTGDPDSVADLVTTFEDVVDRLPELKSKMVDRNSRWVAEEASVDATAARVAEITRQLSTLHRTSR